MRLASSRAHARAEGSLGQRRSARTRIKDGCVRYSSTRAPGSIWIARGPPPTSWLLSVEHSEVIAEIAHAIVNGGPKVMKYRYLRNSRFGSPDCRIMDESVPGSTSSLML